MKTEPIQIIPVDLSKFISDNKLCVIKAGLEETVDFNSTLNNQLNQFYKANLKIGFINIENLDYANAFVQSLIGERMINIGLDGSETMLPGYYLFKDSRLVAYHPGTFDISKLDVGEQKAYLWIGAIAGVLSGLSQKSFASALLTFSATMEVPTGMSIFKFFKEVLESKNELDIKRKQKLVFLTEIDNAYALLKVSKTATDEEVKKAWKSMLKEFHPDKSKEDKEGRTKLCVSINEAYEIIMNHRKASKSKFSFS
jgi:hypothetical protein